MTQSMHALPPQYDPTEIEPRWADFWVREKLYRADPKKSGAPYSIVIPPPNVTGVLHMGHALNATLQDILIRYHRMKGDNTCWVVGTDHAGIATQNVVEKQLSADGLTRQDLGRDAFIEKVWQWREASGGTIIAQLKRLGASCDFTRERFTMDEGLSRAVREAFVTLYDDGLIYRGERLINWCPRCQTALSDLEVEHEEKDGALWPIQYPVAGSDRRITVATTRPETYLGDTAVAVHPDDERYQSLIGQTVELPLLGRRIPIVADPGVDREFGTGAVKITPAHDFNDFELGNRHRLPRLTILNPDGTLNEAGGAYAGLDRLVARKRIVDDLIAAGFIDEAAIAKHTHQVGHCYRCHTVVEPYLSLQWFVKAAPLAEKAMAAVVADDTQFFPENWEKTYFQWLETIRDWCISRQIWWGHQIPAWYCETGHTTVSRDEPTTCSVCGSSHLTRDPDVLDTWFSSSLWPFSTLGWPKGEGGEATLFDRYYPTSVLVTAFDIIFFWVARMMMMGLYFTGKAPFRHVYIHALVRDATGQKMSKSKGNVVDPLAIMGEYGTDAFRFTLAALAAQGRDIRLDEARIEGYRNFINKIWNATRFVLRYLPETTWNWREVWEKKKDDTAFAPNFWIRHRLSQTIQTIDAALASYAFNDAALAAYHYFWNEYCAWYIEWMKPVLNDDTHPERETTLATALAVLDASLHLLHPFIPFVTEEIWQHLSPTHQSLSLSAYPDSDRMAPPRTPLGQGLLAQAEHVISVTETVRRLRGENGVPPAVKLHLELMGPLAETLTPYEAMIKQMARIETIAYHPQSREPEKSAIAKLSDELTLAIPMQGIIDIDAELARLAKEGDKLAKDISKLEAKFANASFIERAPPDIVEKDRELLLSLKEKQRDTEMLSRRMATYR